MNEKKIEANKKEVKTGRYPWRANLTPEEEIKWLRRTLRSRDKRIEELAYLLQKQENQIRVLSELFGDKAGNCSCIIEDLHNARVGNSELRDILSLVHNKCADASDDDSNETKAVRVFAKSLLEILDEVY
jgi:hypothetical protein